MLIVSVLTITWSCTGSKYHFAYSPPTIALPSLKKGHHPRVLVSFGAQVFRVLQGSKLRHNINNQHSL